MSFLNNSLWFKILSDGQTEYGRDGDIILRKASWTKGRQDIIAASYIFDNYTQGFVILCLPVEKGSYAKIRQFDQMVSSVRTGSTKRVKRSFEIENCEYNHLYRHKNFNLKNDIIQDGGGRPVDTEVIFFHLSHTALPGAETVLPSEVIKQSGYITLSIDEDGNLGVDTT